MTTEAPKFEEGPLDNPEWTREQNRRYDINENFQTPQAAREAALGSEGETDDGVDDFQRAAVERAKRTVEQTGSKKGKRKPPTRYISPRDAGPPPHVAEEIRRAQGLLD